MLLCGQKWKSRHSFQSTPGATWGTASASLLADYSQIRGDSGSVGHRSISFFIGPEHVNLLLAIQLVLLMVCDNQVKHHKERNDCYLLLKRNKMPTG